MLKKILIFLAFLIKFDSSLCFSDVLTFKEQGFSVVFDEKNFIESEKNFDKSLNQVIILLQEANKNFPTFNVIRTEGDYNYPVNIPYEQKILESYKNIGLKNVAIIKQCGCDSGNCKFGNIKLQNNVIALTYESNGEKFIASVATVDNSADSKSLSYLTFTEINNFSNELLESEVFKTTCTSGSFKVNFDENIIDSNNNLNKSDVNSGNQAKTIVITILAILVIIFLIFILRKKLK